MNSSKTRGSNERVEDMHLLLSEKYQTYKDLADRCLINAQHIDKGDKRVFYLKPDSIFLEEPRKQNQYRNEFMKIVSTPPGPEPFTLFADDLHRDFIDMIQDRSNPSVTKQELANFFKRRHYKLQHKKYKLLQRWAHHALTSELVDKVSLKFSPTYSKLQFEMENAVKRYSRLEGEDHFLNVSRPETSSNGEKLMNEFEEKINPQSSLRIDDIDVYLRIVTYEEKINRDSEQFIQKVKWVPLQHRFQIFQDSIEYFQKLRTSNLQSQRELSQKLEQKGSHLIQFRKLGLVGQEELSKIIDSQTVTKLDQRSSQDTRARYLDTCKYNYEKPKIIIWNDLELKLQLQSRSAPFGIHGDLEIDSGHSFAYSIMVFFPTYFQAQVIKSQFALYDAVPALIDPSTLAKKNIQSVLDRNRKKYGNSLTGKNSLLEKLEIQAKQEQLQTEFINSVEKALFGEFNGGQIKDFPSVRLKKSEWIKYVCYEPVLSNDQKYQASILSGELNPIDDCLKHTLDLLNVQDVTNVNLILESLSSIHHDKLKHGEIKTEFLLSHAFMSEQDLIDKLDSEHVFTEGERSFLSIFKGCLRSKSDYSEISNQTHEAELHKHSLLQVPQHLLFSLYMLKFLSGRDAKIKLLYVLNSFRAIQKRIVFELREMGTRDRILGDVNFLGPMENAAESLSGNDTATNNNPSRQKPSSKSLEKPNTQSSQNKFQESSYSSLYQPNSLSEGAAQRFYTKYADRGGQDQDKDKDSVDIINDNLVDIQKYKFNSKFKNFVYSTCPIIPRYHATFGEPTDRQEISAELENNKKADNKKEEGLRLMGRVDTIYFDEISGYWFVKDDFGMHILFDASLLDMKNMEQEVLKICSLYIQKQEPLLDYDLRNIFPIVDRLDILDEAFQCELDYQHAKLELALTYLECLEHISDTLDQQRMIQIIVDLMALRPRLNLSASHFKDSYKAEVDKFNLQKQLLKEVMRLQMKNEFEQNNFIREYLERTYRLVMEQVENKFQYQKPENLDQELKARENLCKTQKYFSFMFALEKGIIESNADQLAQESIQTQDTQKGNTDQEKPQSNNAVTNYLESKARRMSQETIVENKPQIFSAKFSDPKEFANYLGIPFASLQMLMKDYKERDPLVKQSIHEHVSFIKIEEGYPTFMYDMSSKQNNTLLMTRESQRIGILDFYESMHIIVRVIAAMQIAFEEIKEVHRPDNGLTATSLEIATYRYFLSELKVIKRENTLTIDKPSGLNYLEDDSILGNPDKMMFYAKEFLASAEDQQASHNPYILTKLNLKTIENFSFEAFQKLIIENANTTTTGSIFQDAGGKQSRKITTHHAYRFFPKLKTRAQKVMIPSMLFLTCNSIEMLRLRKLLIQLIAQKKILEEVYQKQVKLIGKDGRIYFKDQFNFENFIELGEKNYINFVDDGPATGIEIDLAINEFDPTLRSAINFSDPDGYKAMICPLGLEELRAVALYELMNLQTLIVATRTNQALLDNLQRHLSELELFQKGWVVANPTFDYYLKLSGSNLLESNIKKLYMNERSVVLSQLSGGIGDIYYNIISRKNRNRNFLEKHFQKHRVELIQTKEKHELQLRKVRTFRMSLLQDFCQDVLAEVYGDAIKLQLLVSCDQIRKRSYLIPKESNIFEIGVSLNGEYCCAAYNVENNSSSKAPKFLDKTKRKIQRLWRIPSNKEILKLPNTYEQVKSLNLSHLFQFEINPNTKKLQPNFAKNSQHKILRMRLPKLKFADLSDMETIYKDKARFVEFDNAYTYQYIFNSAQLLTAQQSPILLSILFYFTSLQNFFDLELFQNKIGSCAQTIATLEHNVLAGLPFWEESDEALFNQSSQQSQQPSLQTSPRKGAGTNLHTPISQKTSQGKHSPFDSKSKQSLESRRNLVADIGYKNELSKFVIERIAKEKKQKLTLHQELESIKDKFVEFETIMFKLELNDDIMNAAMFLNEQAHLSYYGLLASLTQVQQFYQKDANTTVRVNPQKELLDLNRLIMSLSHFDDTKITYTNGFHVNNSITRVSQSHLDESNTKFDYNLWQRSVQPVIDENALAPSQFTLINSMFEQSAVNLKTFKKNRVFMGKMPSRDYSFLDLQLMNIDKNMRRYVYSNFVSVDQQLKEYLRYKFNHEDQYFVGNLNQYFDLLFEKKQYLKTLLKSRQLKRIVMILLGDEPVPNDFEALSRLQTVFTDEVQWKINTRWDDYQINKIKRQEREQTRRLNTQGARENLTASQINNSLKKRDDGQNSNVISQLELAQVEIEVLSNEVQRFLISASFKLLDRESTSLAKAFELNGKQFEFYIHPCQQFASTRDQKVDKRNHLDIINKVSFAQKFLTQIRNRCLEIETITSGVGMVISQKDLNECIEEACRSLIKAGEVEMRSRCETFAIQQVQYENLIYVKDRQLLNMEEKLKHSKNQLDKLIRTKVYSKGNQLVYELDTATRQLRLVKDNLFEMEKKLSEKMRLEFERELDQRQMELQECRRKFAEFQANVNARVMADVRENVNNIDTLMKNKAEHFKDLSKGLALQTQNSFSGVAGGTTININQLTIKNVAAGSTNSQLSGFNLSGGDQAYFQRMIKEFEVLKQNEKESREEVIKLQEVIRKMRIFDRFKTVLTNQQYEHKLDNLREQLNSNTLLWEQLAEGEKREKILKRELEQAQQEIVTQEKIIEQVKDELKKERAEKLKLIQYKQTKSKRLEELEGKAREFEVLHNLNLPKVLNMLESKEDKIQELQSKEKLLDAQMHQIERLKAQELSTIKKKYESEVKMKSEAMNKLETLRHELHLIEGADAQAVEVWKDKCRKLIEICKSFKEENDKLQVQLQLGMGLMASSDQSERQSTARLEYLLQQTAAQSETTGAQIIGNLPFMIANQKNSQRGRSEIRETNNSVTSGIGSSYIKKQSRIIDNQTNNRHTSSIIREEVREDQEFTTTQGSVKSSQTYQPSNEGSKTGVINTSKDNTNSFRVSNKSQTRFKLKNDIKGRNGQQISMQYNQLQSLNQSVDNPYLGVGSSANMSIVLAGNTGAFTGTMIGGAGLPTLQGQSGNDKLSQSFVDQYSRREHSVDAPSRLSQAARNKRLTQVQPRGNSTKEIHGTLQSQNKNNNTNSTNIFSGKVQVEPQGNSSTPPKTPTRNHQHQPFELESHSSSVYGKLTPVYDPKLGLTQQQRKLQQYATQQRGKDSVSGLGQGSNSVLISTTHNPTGGEGNVFSSLGAIQSNTQFYFTQGSTNMIGQVSQEQLQDNIQSVTDPYNLQQQGRNLTQSQISGKPSNLINQISLFGQRLNNNATAQDGNAQQQLPNIMMAQGLNLGDKSSRNTNMQGNLTGNNFPMSGGSNLLALGQNSLMNPNLALFNNNLEGTKSRSQSNQTHLVKSKVVSPPKALQREIERPGFKGQVVKKQPSHGQNNESLFQ